MLEVKATFNKQNIIDARDKLLELVPLASGVDKPDEQYKKYLHPNFCCAVVFIEMTSDEAAKFQSYVNELLSRIDEKYTASIDFIHSDQPIPKVASENLYAFTITEGGAVSYDSKKIYLATCVKWDEVSFSIFAFGLVKRMAGEHRPGFLPSFHGLPFHVGV